MTIKRVYLEKRVFDRYKEDWSENSKNALHACMKVSEDKFK